MKIVAVSGGVDSMCLLHMMKAESIVVAHVNYGLRANAQKETALVKDYCDRHHLICEIIYAPRFEKGNFQHEARKYRYQFFKSLCDKYNCDEVYTAHHQDDLIETYLLQLERKTIPHYYGIADETVMDGFTVFRPLLQSTKKALMQYALENHIPYLDDDSNFELKYARNKIRNVIKNVDENQIQMWLNEIKIKNKTKIDPFEKTRQLLFRHRIYHFSDKQLKNIELFLLKGKGIFKLNESLNLYSDGSIHANFEEYSFTLNDLETIENAYFEFKKSDTGFGIKASDFPITIRNFNPGDKIKLSFGTKKISRIFIDKKIPLYERFTCPIILNKDNEVIYAGRIGVAISNKNVSPNCVLILK